MTKKILTALVVMGTLCSGFAFSQDNAITAEKMLKYFTSMYAPSSDVRASRMMTFGQELVPERNFLK
ncbi:MAG: hypothetical protein EOM80_03785 [Erysipelotrichia bacterium]|nr:hypothetical protein [Erysipelotrichia bacterium]